jgi:23S rRNA pseudouridine2605 synthase
MSGKAQNRHQTGMARALSKLGYCSRSQGFALVRAGRVRLNGRVVRDPEIPVFWGKDHVEVDGAPVGQARKVYLMLNKPRGVVTSARDEKGRKTVYSLLPGYEGWVAPVGRLDMASEGLLLLTNDSDWGARIAAPDAHVEKTYHVQIAALAGQDLLDRLKRGVRTTDGDFLAVKSARLLRLGRKNSWLEIVLEEGKNRHIRRMLAALAIEVMRLVRVAIGQVMLGDLGKGKTRVLTAAERNGLWPKPTRGLDRGNDFGAFGASRLSRKLAVKPHWRVIG